MAISIAIVEDLKETREGLQARIQSEPGFFCSGVFEDAESFAEKFKHLDANIVLMDIDLPGRSGIECVRQLSEKRKDVIFCMCTNYEDTDKIIDALYAGAKGYILKNISKEKFIDAIKDMHQGGSPMSPEVARKIIDTYAGRQKNNELLQLLTNRQVEVINLLDKGYSYKEVAEKLSISVETVRTYIRNIYEKLEVHNRHEALNKLFPKRHL